MPECGHWGTRTRAGQTPCLPSNVQALQRFMASEGAAPSAERSAVPYNLSNQFQSIDSDATRSVVISQLR